MKAAVISQLRQLHAEHPSRKVALVTFESQVIQLLFGGLEISGCRKINDRMTEDTNTEMPLHGVK